MSAYYEWVVETVEQYELPGEGVHEGDVVDLDHFTTYAEALDYANGTQLEYGEFFRIGLVKTNLYGRGWAYIEDDKLPTRFENAMGGDMGTVPAKYLKQFTDAG